MRVHACKVQGLVGHVMELGLYSMMSSKSLKKRKQERRICACVLATVGEAGRS